jgi:hypothetical protein
MRLLFYLFINQHFDMLFINMKFPKLSIRLFKNSLKINNFNGFKLTREKVEIFIPKIINSIFQELIVTLASSK